MVLAIAPARVAAMDWMWGGSHDGICEGFCDDSWDYFYDGACNKLAVENPQMDRK